MNFPLPASSINRTIAVALLILALFAPRAAGQQEPKPNPPAEGGPPAAQATGDTVKVSESADAGNRAWFGRLLDRLDSPPDAGPRRGWFPVVGVVTPGSGLGAGLGYRDEAIHGWPLGFEASSIFSYRGYEGYALAVGKVRGRESRAGLGIADTTAPWMLQAAEGPATGFSAYAEVNYRDYPEQPFYGPGANHSGVRRADFLLFGTSSDAVAQYQATRTFGIALRGGLTSFGLGAAAHAEHPNLESVLDADGARSPLEPQQFVTLGAGAVLDTRASHDDPRNGIFLGGAVWRFANPASSQFDFTRVLVDARSYLTPFGDRGVLALRALLSADITAPGARVPFYLQQTLGGAATLRGFATDRFRGDAVASVSAEYRRQVNDFLDLGPFLDVGAVGPGPSRLSMSAARAGFGLRAGIRYRSHVLFHLDVGRSTRRGDLHVTAGIGVLF